MSYGFYAKNDVGGMLVCQGAKGMWEVAARHVSVVSSNAHESNMDAYGWSHAVWGAASYAPVVVKQVVRVVVPTGSVLPVLYFKAQNPQHIKVNSNAFHTRRTWETSGGTDVTWVEGRSNTPTFTAGISDVTVVSVGVDGEDTYHFTVLIAINDRYIWDNGVWGLDYRAFTSVTLATRDITQSTGFELYDSNGGLSFTSRPKEWYFNLKSVMKIGGASACIPPNAVADRYSMAPHGNSVTDSSDAVWISYYCGTFGAVVGPTVVYRSHKGGGGYAEVSFTDNYYFASHGLFVSGITPGACNGSLWVAGMPITVGRTLGKAHSEDWGSLGVVGAVVAAALAVYTGGGALAALGAATVAGTAISQMTFYHGISSNQSVTDRFTGDEVVWLSN